MKMKLLLVVMACAALTVAGTGTWLHQKDAAHAAKEAPNTIIQQSNHKPVLAGKSHLSSDDLKNLPRARETPLIGIPLASGIMAPEFELPDQTGKVHKLSDYRGTTVVLAWFPKAFTGG